MRRLRLIVVTAVAVIGAVSFAAPGATATAQRSGRAAKADPVLDSIAELDKLIRKARMDGKYAMAARDTAQTRRLRMQIERDERTRAELYKRLQKKHPAPQPPTRTVAQQAAEGGLVVSTDWLARHLVDPAVVLLHVDRTDSAYREGHISGARWVRYESLSIQSDGIGTELPPVDSLQALFESVGVSSTSHVVLTGPPLMVTRAFFTLDYLGHARVSALDGGVKKWKAEGRATQQEAPAVARGRLAPRARPEILASADWVLARIGKPGVSLVDTRTEGEYLGTEGRRGLPSNGHIEGARRLEWQEMFRDPSEFTLKDREELARLWRQRVTPGDTVVSYCLVGYRASGTYFVSRLLGYPVKLYDGSYDDWSKKNLPLVKTVTPLREP